MKKVFNKKILALFTIFVLFNFLILSNPLLILAEEQASPSPTPISEEESAPFSDDGQLVGSCFGRAAKFDGDDDALEVVAPILINNLSFYTSPQYFTIEAYIRPAGEWGRSAIIAREMTPSDTTMEFKIDDDRLYAKINTIAGFTDYASGIVRGRTIIKNDDKWHHVAFVRNGKFIQLFLDGKPDSEPTQIIQNGIQFAFGGTFTIGAQRVSPWFTFITDEFKGYIDEVRVSNIARYNQEFLPKKSPFTPDSNTLALWHMDDAPGSTVAKDSSTLLPARFGRNNAQVRDSVEFEDSTIVCDVPALQANVAPIIQTARFPTAQKYHPLFNTTIRVTDANRSDKIFVWAEGLPDGVSLVCPETHPQSRIDCALEGIVNTRGTFRIKINAKDQNEAIVSKTLTLIVSQ